MNIQRLTALILLAALTLVGGCGRGTDPLTGWQKWGADTSYHLDKAIMDDYEAYIQTLPSWQRDTARQDYSHLLCEDGTGQHAIELDLPHDGKHWKHVLIYDNNNKRIKVIKYGVAGTQADECGSRQIQTKRTVKLHRLAILLLLTALLSPTGGCGRGTDPLKGWKKWEADGSDNLDKAIMDDYQAYIKTLPSLEKEIASVPLGHFFCEDGAGRHAVELDIPHGGKSWKHVLIYDKNNIRIKVIKYWSGKYSS